MRSIFCTVDRGDEKAYSRAMQKRSRMPRDTNQLAHKILQIAIGEDTGD